jgi:hypothetical protein
VENSTGSSYVTGKKHVKYFTPVDELPTLTCEKKQRTQKHTLTLKEQNAWTEKRPRLLLKSETLLSARVKITPSKASKEETMNPIHLLRALPPRFHPLGRNFPKIFSPTLKTEKELLYRGEQSRGKAGGTPPPHAPHGAPIPPPPRAPPGDSWQP